MHDTEINIFLLEDNSYSWQVRFTHGDGTLTEEGRDCGDFAEAFTQVMACVAVRRSLAVRLHGTYEDGKLDASIALVDRG